MDTPLQTRPDPQDFLKAVHEYYAELLHFHQRQAVLIEKIVEKGFQGIEAAALYKDGRDGVNNAEKSTNGVSDGFVIESPIEAQSAVSVERKPPEASKTKASKSTKKGSSQKGTSSREPSSEVLPVKGDLGQSILHVMRQSPEVPATASSIAAALNPSGIPAKDKGRAYSRYADRLGTLVKKDYLIRIANGLFMLADAPPEAIARATEEFSDGRKAESPTVANSA
jgi:hypothetical protein